MRRTCWGSLDVRRSGDRELWMIERFAWDCPYKTSDQVLAHVFGSTPIFTRNYQSAMRLADYCELNGPPRGLHWMSTAANDPDGSVEFARQRRQQEDGTIEVLKA